MKTLNPVSRAAASYFRIYWSSRREHYLGGVDRGENQGTRQDHYHQLLLLLPIRINDQGDEMLNLKWEADFNGMYY
jgi:hypothetical protein